MSELFAAPGRPTASAIAVVANWLANTLVGLFFPPLNFALGPWVFLIFLVIQARSSADKNIAKYGQYVL